MHDDDVAGLFTKLGLERADSLPPADIAKSALSGRSVDLVRPFPMTVKRAVVNGQPRVELVGCPAEQLPWIKSLGCFTEIIHYRTRVFLPVQSAAEILDCVKASGRLLGT